jgi:hypothetical protein
MIMPVQPEFSLDQEGFVSLAESQQPVTKTKYKEYNK